MQKGLLWVIARGACHRYSKHFTRHGGTLMPHHKQYLGNAKGCWSEAMAFG